MCITLVVDTGSGDEQEEGNEQEVDKSEEQEVDPLPLPRPLHMTRSVYVKRVPPNITTADIEEVSVWVYSSVVGCTCVGVRVNTHSHALTGLSLGAYYCAL